MSGHVYLAFRLLVSLESHLLDLLLLSPSRMKIMEGNQNNLNLIRSMYTHKQTTQINSTG